MAHRITVKAKDDFRSFKKDYEINFDFEDTNINFLIGKNGCGKSTLIRAIRTMPQSRRKTLRNTPSQYGEWAPQAQRRLVIPHRSH